MQPVMAAKMPRILWIELTSKCPLDCVFCSRKTRRGAGEHMPYSLFESLVREIPGPRTFRLNYSGESTVHPELIPAIRLARSTPVTPGSIGLEHSQRCVPAWSGCWSYPAM